MKWAGCAARLGSAGAEAAARVNRALSLGWWEVSLIKAARAWSGSTGLGGPWSFIWGSGRTATGLETAQVVWPFVLQSFDQLISKRQAVITPTSRHCQEVLFLWAPRLYPLLLGRPRGEGVKVSCFPAFVSSALGGSKSIFFAKTLEPWCL